MADDDATTPQQIDPAQDRGQDKETRTANDRTLVQKISHIILNMDAVAKGGQVKFGDQFKYIRSEDLMAVLSKRMAREGIVCIPSIIEIGPVPETQKQFAAKMSMLLINVDSPEDRMTVPWYAMASNMDDKGINKIATSGLKYFLLKLFMISDSTEPDPDAEPGDGSDKKGARGTGRGGTATNEKADPEQTPEHMELLKNARIALGKDRKQADALKAITANAGPLEKQTDAELTRTISYLQKRAAAAS